MSLNQEERNIMVGLELEKAKSTFAEYEGLTEKGYWNTLANRLYYLYRRRGRVLLADGDPTREVRL